MRYSSRVSIIGSALLSVSLVIVPYAAVTSAAAANVPLCTDHHPTRWHPLAMRLPNGTVICTYGHEHGDNPHTGDALFGKLPIPQRQEISYPWQTGSAPGHMENDLKHEFYKWTVQNNVPCNSGDDLSFNAFRTEAHHDGHAGAVVRFHSYFLQARGCDPRDPSWSDGFVTLAGRMDTGMLVVDPSPNEHMQVRTSEDTNPDYEIATGAKRQHADADPGSPDYQNSTWYGNLSDTDDDRTALRFEPHLFAQLAVDRDVYGPVSPHNPGVYPADSAHPLVFFNPMPRRPAFFGVHIIALNLDGQFPQKDASGFVTWRGYLSRYGAFLRNGCGGTPIGPDCVPIQIRHMKVGTYQFRNDLATPGVGPHHNDVAGPDGQSLATFPN